MRVFFLLLFLSFNFALSAKATICLNMIVKNESAVIKRCLDSVKPIIDYWVIVDTGSTDGTQKVIREHMKDIPGELHERPWKNFGFNRTEAIHLTKDKSDYLLFMDADDWLEYTPNFQLPDLSFESYLFQCGSISSGYMKPLLVKADLPWEWVGILHEYLTCYLPTSTNVLSGVRYVVGCDGASHQDPEKYTKYAAMLEKALQEEPDNARYAFYLAESYRTAGNHLKAIEWYANKVSMGGWDEEVFWSLLQIAKLLSTLEVEKDVVISSFYRAHRYRPHRPEPIYYLAELFNQSGQYALAYACIKGSSFIPQPMGKDILFREDWTRDWGLAFQLSICAFYLGYYQESVELCDQLLKMEHIPKNFQDQIAINRTFPYEKIMQAIQLSQN